MENKINSVIRLAFAGIAIMGGAALFTSTPMQASTPLASTTVTMDGSHPPALCDPNDPNCVRW